MKTILFIDSVRKRLTEDLEWTLSLLEETQSTHNVFTKSEELAERYVTAKHNLKVSKEFSKCCDASEQVNR